MCLLLLAYQSHPYFKIIMASNRDEARSRESLAASFWQEAPHIVGGKDLVRGGSWLAFSKDGRFAATTNIYEAHKNEKNSRGWLVSEYLLNGNGPHDYLHSLSVRAHQFPAFNLVLGGPNELMYFSNRLFLPRRLTAGIHGLSNEVLGSDWPKVDRGIHALTDLVRGSSQIQTEKLFDILSSPNKAQGGVQHSSEDEPGQTWRKNDAFVSFNDFATRSSTVILVDQEDCVTFMERVYGRRSEITTDREFRFKISA